MELRVINLLAHEDVLHVCKNMREADREEIFATTDCKTPEQYASQIIRMSGVCLNGWVASLDGEPIALVGTSRMWQGVDSVWMFATPSFNKIRLSLTKFIKRHMIPVLVKECGIHRGQCFSMNGHVVAHAWLEVLGAKREAVVKGYGRNGEDFTLFSWRF